MTSFFFGRCLNFIIRYERQNVVLCLIKLSLLLFLSFLFQFAPMLSGLEFSRPIDVKQKNIFKMTAEVAKGRELNSYMKNEKNALTLIFFSFLPAIWTIILYQNGVQLSKVLAARPPGVRTFKKNFFLLNYCIMTRG